MADDLLERVRATGLLAAGADVVVLLSGGRDSVCLLDVAVALGCRGAGAARQLRPARRRRATTRRTAARCASASGWRSRCTVATRPDDAPGNLQAWARDVRYAAAARAAGGGLVAVGHTASDQAETVLYRLAASPGRRALLGMRPRSGHLVRPLLAVTREETGAWCRARGLAWRDDATNASDDFARGRVRHGLLAALEAVDARAAANVVRTAELLREEAEVLDVVVDTALAGRDRIALAVPGRPAPGARAARRAPPRRGRHRRPVRPRRGAPGRHPGARRGRARWTSATARGRWSRVVCCASRRRRRLSGLRSRARFCAAQTASSREGCPGASLLPPTIVVELLRFVSDSGTNRSSSRSIAPEEWQATLPR